MSIPVTSQLATASMDSIDAPLPIVTSSRSSASSCDVDPAHAPGANPTGLGYSSSPPSAPPSQPAPSAPIAGPLPPPTTSSGPGPGQYSDPGYSASTPSNPVAAASPSKSIGSASQPPTKSSAGPHGSDPAPTASTGSADQPPGAPSAGTASPPCPGPS